MYKNYKQSLEALKSNNLEVITKIRSKFNGEKAGAIEFEQNLIKETGNNILTLVNVPYGIVLGSDLAELTGKDANETELEFCSRVGKQNKQLYNAYWIYKEAVSAEAKILLKEVDADIKNNVLWEWTHLKQDYIFLDYISPKEDGILDIYLQILPVILRGVRRSESFVVFTLMADFTLLKYGEAYKNAGWKMADTKGLYKSQQLAYFELVGLEDIIDKGKQRDI